MSDLRREPATLAHAKDLGPRLRQADRDEVKAGSGMDAAEVLLVAVAHAKQADAWFMEGRLVAISGISGSLVDTSAGVIWMLASDELDQFPKQFMKGRRQYVRDLLKGYDMLFNFVDNRNTKAQKWLQWLGFTLGEPRPFGVAGLLFRPFTLSAHGDVYQQLSPGRSDITFIEVSHV